MRPEAPARVVFALTGDVTCNSRAIKQLRALERLGVEVTVLTLRPPGGEVPAARTRLVAIPRPPGGGPRFFWRVHRAMRREALRHPARIYHASDLYTLPAMAAAARRHGGKLVYDARELYPYVASTAGRPAVRQFWKALEGRYVRRADAVFTVSPSIAEQMRAAYGIEAPPVLYNVPEHRAVAPSDRLRERLGLTPDTVLFLHQGQIQKDRGCTVLAEAMRAVPGAVLVFLGGGALKPALQQHVDAEGLAPRVRFLDPVPPDELLDWTASADVGVTLLEDTCLNHRFALPNKLFEYLMAGLPVLASDLPEIRRLVVGYDVGCVVDPGDAGALAAALRRMALDAAQRAQWAAHAPRVLETFSWEKASEALVSRYERLLAVAPLP